MGSKVADRRSEDWQLIERCLDGDREALLTLQRQHLDPLRGVLINRGGTPAQVDDLLGNVLGDCVVGREPGAALLERYNGKCSLRNWLATIATNRLYDLLRRNKWGAQLPRSEDDDEDPMDREPSQDTPPPEPGLARLVAESIRAGFAQCPVEELLMLRLVYLHGVSQRDICRMWGWTEPKVSRRLSAAMKTIQAAALEHFARCEPKLKLDWEDILEICRTEGLSFL